MQQVLGRIGIDRRKNLTKAEFSAELFGIYLSKDIEERFAKKSQLQRGKNLIPIAPRLSRNETLMLYDKLLLDYGKVTLGVMEEAVGSHVGDALCTTD